MNREEFGKLVVALRKEHRDENDETWTQPKLAQLTKLSETVIGKIERGERVNLEPDILLSLAKTFQLTSRERKEFFYAAIDIDDKQVNREETSAHAIRDKLIEMMRHIRLPAFIMDVYGDIVAANSAIIALLDVPSEIMANGASVPAGHNLIRVVFSSKSNFRELVKENWHEYAIHNLRVFRAMSLRYRHTDYFQYIFSGFRNNKEYSLFNKYWQQIYYEEEDHYIDSILFRYAHPNFGELSYYSTSIVAITPYGQLDLVNYIPANQKAAEVFTEIISRVGMDTHKFASWPEKEIRK